MSRRIVRIARRALRFVPAIVLVIAIASYAALLGAAHGATKDRDIRTADVQRLAYDATDTQNARGDRRNGSLEIGRLWRHRSEARWELAPVDALSPDAKIVRVRIFMTGLGFSMYGPSSYARISVNGLPLGLLRPDTRPPHRSPFPVLDPPVEPVDVAPGVEPAFVFDIPPGGACVRTPCTIRVETEGTLWIVRRVGVVFATQTPEPALWPNAFAAWRIVTIAAVLAVLSHLALSVRGGRKRVAPAADWKTT